MCSKLDNNINYYNQEIEITQDFINICSEELIQEIFSYLNLASFNRSSCVSKKWRQLASEPLLWKNAIYGELAFGIAQWAQCCGEEAIKDESRQEEFSSLPLNVAEYYKNYQHTFPKRVFENIQAALSECFLLFSRLSSLLEIIENIDKSIQASVVSGRLSKSLLMRRFLVIQAKVLSTIHLQGRISKPLTSSFRLTISNFNPSSSSTQ